jgi:hypothetical protein
VRETLQQLREVAGHCAGTPVWSLPDTDLVNAIHAVHDTEQMLAAVKLHLPGAARCRRHARIHPTILCRQ